MLVKHVVNIARKSLIVPQFSSVFTSARTYPSPLSCNPNHRTLCSATPTRNDVAVLTDMADSSDLDDTIQGKMYIEFTCKKCNHRSCKHFSKHAYQKGIVIIRCEGCQSLHLIADNLGWIKDKHWKLEDFVKVNRKCVDIT
ncbi:Heat shock protein with a zinc finger motif [Clonorchis sinensis]|uniref:Heat shock protein with a zinc finger motif n=1 Tax=Clonorchis sinensis TaxID=79923 RepID=A0A8T1MAC1_CLOSI|nr:Heat shock protein with a zinc finger motif [Clonorchis sinensis]